MPSFLPFVNIFCISIRSFGCFSSLSGSSSLRRMRSKVSSVRCRLRMPSTATLMEPLYSLTTTTTASEFSLMPMPAR